ncbi:MAG: NUDIX domain-containing protein [Chitinophagaceae bacterium]|nr:MAG: NUDIX domain-containing protein [Chitinophagaceae bacterium]
MKIPIYFNEKPVYLCDKMDKELTELTHHPDAIFIDEFSTPAINSLLHEIKKDDFHAGVVLHNDLEELKRAFFKHFKTIEAAGGIVQNENKDILFIHRRGKWDLPKGKMEKAETEEVCAQREVEEETGVTALKLKKKVGVTYHTYDEFGKHILKISHWFYFTCDSKNQVLTPQTEEDITETKWIKTKDIRVPMNDTYENIKDIMRRFFDEP